MIFFLKGNYRMLKITSFCLEIPPLCEFIALLFDTKKIGIGILIRIGINGVWGIKIKGKDILLQVTIQGGWKEVVIGIGGRGVIYYEKEDDECEDIIEKEV